VDHRAGDVKKLREIAVFAVLFALPFASAFAVEAWAALLLCPLGVVGVLGLNESVGPFRAPLRRRLPGR
jgi:hypothetical protein